MKICCVIPARLNSTRFPNKILQYLNGVKILDRVINIAKESSVFDKIILATDSKIIEEKYKNDIEVFLMDEDVWCGSLRAYYVYKKYPNYDCYVTLPSDEPMINSIELKKSLLNYFIGKIDLIATMGSSWREKEIERFKSVKSCKILSSNDYIICFSRYPIPISKNNTININFSKKHLGVFVFSKTLFEKFKDEAWGNFKGSIAEFESLEQTIFLENGFKVRLIPIIHESHGVDTPEDMKDI